MDDDAIAGQVSLLCGCGVEDTPRWVGASSLHPTRNGVTDLGRDLELVYNEGVLSRGKGPGVHKEREKRERPKLYLASESA